jgi:microcystin-dependent protein
MAGTLIYITDAGRAALVAPANDGTNAHKIVEIGLATASFNAANPALVALPNERKRITTFAGENVAFDTIHVTLKDDTDDQFTLYGFGLYLENGVLAAVYSQATPIMEKAAAAMLLLSADLQFTTIDAATLTFGDASFTNPPATTERQGVIELATQDETTAGTDASRAVTPATLKTQLDKKANLAGADFAGPVGTSGSFKVTSAAGSPGTFEAGNGDNASKTTNNVALRSWFGIGFGPNIDGMAVPKTEFSHWFDTRTGNAGFRGALDVGGLITAQGPAAGDVSNKVATTAFVASAIANAMVGQIIFEPRTTARAGFLKCNGALLNRADYPALWAYAQASGCIVAEASWSANYWGCFSTGNGTTTFRIPELRGEFLRCWDDARGADGSRGIGTYQGTQNIWHAHGASAAAVGDHVHSAWTDSQGWHGHHGNTYGVGDHQHILDQNVPAWSNPDTDRGGASSWFSIDNARQPYTSWNGAHGHGFDTDGAGTHGHNVGIGGAGNHTHGITVNGDGGNEARPRNIALLAVIRAY